ncbi:MAG TPA: twin-arginine translocation pathway signal, partial [Thermoanaerobaculia bacterium]|nr:twin-arginine translocation pathway signal [Thermoanaerobaculia bacterium]
MLSRRELLAAFLGAPFAAFACRRAPQHELPPGEIAGASDAVGHRLRNPITELPREWISEELVIVGAGVAGLAAAWRLNRNALVLELEEVAG